MDWVKLRTHIIDHPRMLEAGAVARDLYTWGMLYAGAHETDGAIPMVALLVCPWGKGGKGNVLVANKLVSVGLWERTDTGYRVLRWAEQGNQTRAQIQADREAARERMTKKRSPKPEACSPELRTNFGRSSPNVPTSTSYSLSGSDLGSREGVQGETDGAEPPEWFVEVLATVAMATGETIAAPAAWLRYRGHRAKKGEPVSARDAEYWVTSVIVAELKRERQLRHEREDREAVRARERREGPPPPPKPSREQAKREAQAFAASLRARFDKTGSEP